MEVKISQAVSFITKCIKAKLVPMLEGSPGTGKSQIVYQIAANYNLKVIDLRLSQCDPTDLLGMPGIENDRAGYFPMNTFPIEGDVIPKDYNGWLLFLDEFNSAPHAVQAAAYKLVLDRMVGAYHLHKNVAIVCAGNKDSDNAIVQSMSTALQSRLIHLELVVDAKEWNEWAVDKGIHHHITDYINFKPGNLYTFKPDHSDKTYACPRTWEFANSVLKVTEDGDPDRLPLLAGALSEGIAREFMSFTKIYQDLPKLPEILSSPDSIKVPAEPSILFALTGTISHNANLENFTQLMKFIQRLPTEFQVVCLRETIRRNKEMMAHPALQQWISESAKDLF